MAKIGRNDPCPCKSGLKFKKCHGRFVRTAIPPEVIQTLQIHAADERIRQAQQGLGRAIIAPKFNDYQMVAVGNTIHWSKSWKTFPDFLGDYIKNKLDPAWGNAEIKMPVHERHPIMQWYDCYCRYQAKSVTTPGQIKSAPINGVVACYLGVAYALYLLEHNAELQKRLINRLMNRDNFQGAYYELIVASMLIRAGFTLTPEDETDGSEKHCEFFAVSQITGKRYWVEAKMRAVNGFLGRASEDGKRANRPLARLIPQLNAALQKPASGERLIFIDINAPMIVDSLGMPIWLKDATKRLERFERDELKEGMTAYVFVTNIAFHRDLLGMPQAAMFPFGLGMPDFARPGEMTFGEAYRREQRHVDGHSILQSAQNYLRLPATFDGKLSTESFGMPTTRVVIGETYLFGNSEEDQYLAKVTAATVDTKRREAVIGITDQNNVSKILRIPMTEGDYADFHEVPEAYFGKLQSVSSEPKSDLDMFKWLMSTTKDYSHAKLLEIISTSAKFEELKMLSDEEIKIRYCEGMISAMIANRKKPK